MGALKRIRPEPEHPAPHHAPAAWALQSSLYKSSKLRITQRAINHTDVSVVRYRVLGKAAIALSTEVACAIHVRRTIPIAQPPIGNDAFTDERRIHIGPHGNDVSAHIRALNARKLNGGTAPAWILLINRVVATFGGRLGNRPGIPPRAGIDIGIVHATRTDTNQYILVTRHRYGIVVSMLQFVHVSVPGEYNGIHGVCCHNDISSLLPVLGSVPPGS